ncbi:MAG: TlpA family protein disulfide reductase [Cyclobacteriaceae bacterium]|nr:TlpA family protein disulfide reductase [Cyclobacteriaceae bacterium]
MRILFLLTLIFFSCTSTHKDTAIGLEKIRLTDLSGKTIDYTQYKDKVVLINFWATWCRPCVQEMPTLAAVQDKFKAEPVEFLFASNEALEQITGFKLKKSFDFNYVQVSNLEEQNIQALPTTFIFNKNGELKFSETGYRDWASDESIQILSDIINQP